MKNNMSSLKAQIIALASGSNNTNAGWTVRATAVPSNKENLG
jgi:hypothetical protein